MEKMYEVRFKDVNYLYNDIQSSDFDGNKERLYYIILFLLLHSKYDENGDIISSFLDVEYNSSMNWRCEMNEEEESQYTYWELKEIEKIGLIDIDCVYIKDKYHIQYDITITNASKYIEMVEMPF